MPNESAIPENELAWRRMAAEGDPTTVVFRKETAAAPLIGLDPGPQPDVANRTLSYIISSDRVDRYGDTVVQEGMDTSTYHGQVLYGHHYGGWEQPPLPPIGKNLGFSRAELTDGSGTKVTKALAQFAGLKHNYDLAETVFLLAADGFITDCSIGFRPKPDGWEYDAKTGTYLFLEWQLLEWSIVPIGANTDAVKLAAHAREKKINLAPMADWVARSLDFLAAAGGPAGAERQRLSDAALVFGVRKPQVQVASGAAPAYSRAAAIVARQAEPEKAEEEMKGGAVDEEAKQTEEPAIPAEEPPAEPGEDCPACGATGVCAMCGGSGKMPAAEEEAAGDAEGEAKGLRVTSIKSGDVLVLRAPADWDYAKAERAKDSAESTLVKKGISASVLILGGGLSAEGILRTSPTTVHAPAVEKVVAASAAPPATSAAPAEPALFILAAEPPPLPTFNLDPAKITAMVADALAPTRELLARHLPSGSI